MKYGKCILVLLILFLPSKNIVHAYGDTSNESNIKQGRQSIYQLYDLYEALFPTPEDEDEQSEETNDNVCDSSSYMWPIGSKEVKDNLATGTPVSVTITSKFGSKEAGIHDNGHGGMDIGASIKTNVIAAQSGEVVKASKGCKTGGPKQCGGGFGNYIIIKHDDGNYTLYAHLHQGTLKVKKGKKVSQGQVIAGVGSSGNSTGPHLHFEVREGANNNKSRVDPLKYVDPKKPRPSDGDSCDMSNDFLNFVHGMESGDVYNPKASGTYEAKDEHDGPKWTIGPGLTPSDKVDFKAVGINSDNINVGTKISKAKIEKVFVHTVKRHIDDTKSYLKKKNISLNNAQVLALTSFHYNYGRALSDFSSDYPKYGNSAKLFSTFCNISHAYGHQLAGGLVKRRKLEWIMYTTGVVINNIHSDKVTNTPHDTQVSEGTECVGNFRVPKKDKSKVNKWLEKTASAYNGKITYY